MIRASVAVDPSLIDAEWRRRAGSSVAGVTSTGSKRPPTMFGAAHEDAPSHYVDAAGCRVTTPGGRTFVDCTMALGAVALGYADPAVSARAARQIGRGVTGLTHTLEVQVAERLCATIPCAERALFFKSGAESVAAAVRLARTYTGRSHVIGAGYFGWMDWCSSAAGVPDGVRRDFAAVPWGDTNALTAAAAAAGNDLAAIVVEPVVERVPPDGYLTGARRLADTAHAVLIFDEIKTGFRLHAGGYQALGAVVPDLATFGKALANGFPLAAAVGRRDVMDAVHDTWISSTLASDAVAFGAADAVLDRHAGEDVCAALAAAGRRMRGAVSAGARDVSHVRRHDRRSRRDVVAPLGRSGAGDALPRGRARRRRPAQARRVQLRVTRARPRRDRVHRRGRRGRVRRRTRARFVAPVTASTLDDAALAARTLATDYAALPPVRTPLAGAQPLIDVHAHFFHQRTPRGDWAAVNLARMRSGERIGIGWHVASVLGSWGHTSPTYFPSPDDVTFGNDVMLAVADALPDRVRAYAAVNPNFPAHALGEIERCVARGAIGVKLAASRRADDALLDDVASLAGARGVPILHHVWQWRRRDWPMQEASDGEELGRLAARHPNTRFILAHVGGGGDYMHTYHAVVELPNVYLDLSGSGVDRGMLDGALSAVGPRRLLWACDVTIETGLAKLRALDHVGLGADDLSAIRWGTAASIFPPASFSRASPPPSPPRPSP